MMKYDLIQHSERLNRHSWLVAVLLFLCAAVAVQAEYTPKEVEQLWNVANTSPFETRCAMALNNGWYWLPDQVVAKPQEEPWEPLVNRFGVTGWRPWPGKDDAMLPAARRIWLQRALPQQSFRDPVLLLADLRCDAVAVFFEGQRIYYQGMQHGGLAAARAANRLHWVELPSDAAGGDVMIALYFMRQTARSSDVPMVFYGSRGRLVECLLAGSWQKPLLALLFMVVGVYSFFVHRIRRRYGPSFSHWFAIMTIMLGMSQLMSSAVVFSLLDSAVWPYYSGLLAVLFFPVALWRFAELSLGPGRLKLIRRCWQLQVVVCVLIWIPDVMGWRPFNTFGQVLGNAALALQLAVGIAEGWRHARREKDSRRWMALGLLIFSVAGMLDVVVAMLPLSVSFTLYPWGAFALVTLLAYDQERVAGEAQLKLRRQAEILSRQQEHLEEQVEQRTAQWRRATQQAEAASRAKSDFLANMSHELRTPLNAMLGHAQLLLRDSRTAPDVMNRAQVILQSGEHLLTLINDVLDISRIEAGRLELQSQPLALPKLIQGVVEMMRPRAENKRLRFVYEAPAALPAYITTDEKRVRQVLLNLLSNAIKFTDRGCVELQVDFEAGILRFRVRDTGPGIDPELVDKIFEPFEQAPGTGQQEGTGLGLAISRSIAEKMGGELFVQSTPGVGSEFVFRFSCVVVGTAAPKPITPETTVQPVQLPHPLPEDYIPLREAARIGDLQLMKAEINRLYTTHREDQSVLDLLDRMVENVELAKLQALLNIKSAPGA